MASGTAVPVTVVTGFLGAGKTTLVNRWLADHARGDVAVIVNEHGDVGIDGELLAARVQTLVEITGGCVCCATQGELVRALEAFASRVPPPARVVVETSGAASPAGVLRAIARGGRSGALVLDGVVTVVDATRTSTLVNHDLAIEQVGYADIVVLARADACDGDALRRAEAWVGRYNGAASLVTAAQGTVDPPASTLEALLATRRADFAQGGRGDLAPAASPHVYESVSLALTGDVDGERFADFVEGDLARFAGRLLRAKGILAVDGFPDRMIVQGVADLLEVTFGAPWGETARTSRLVIVGFGLDRAALTAAFASCASSVIHSVD